MNTIASHAQIRAGLVRWSFFTVPLCLGLGFLSGRVAGSTATNPWFASLDKPGLFPPPVTFAVVWTVLYILMGLSLAMIGAARGAVGRRLAIGIFVVQLLLNLAWSPVFFLAHQITVALDIILALVIVVAVTIVATWRVRRVAAVLLLPYLLWICFASLLNFEFLERNPAADGVDDSGVEVRVRL